MRLSDVELETISKAARDERWWQYLRVAQLLLGLSIMFLSLSLIFQLDLINDNSAMYLIGGTVALGGGLIGGVIGRWENKQRQLLIKLSAEIENRSAENQAEADIA